MKRVIFNFNNHKYCQLYFEHDGCVSSISSIDVGLGSLRENVFCDELNVSYMLNPVNISRQTFSFNLSGSFANSSAQYGVSLMGHLDSAYIIIQSSVIRINAQYRQGRASLACMCFRATNLRYYAYNTTFDISDDNNYPSTAVNRTFSAMFGTYQGSSFQVNNITILGKKSASAKLPGSNTTFAWLALSIASEYHIKNFRIACNTMTSEYLTPGYVFGYVPMAYTFYIVADMPIANHPSLGYPSGAKYIQYDMCPQDTALPSGQISLGQAGYACSAINGCQSVTIPAYCNQSAPCNIVNGDVVCTCPTGQTGPQCQDCISGIRKDEYCWENAPECNAPYGACLKKINPESTETEYQCDRCFLGYTGRCCQQCDGTVDSNNRTYINISSKCVQSVPNFRCQMVSGEFVCESCPPGMALNNNRCTANRTAVISVDLITQPFFSAYGYMEQQAYAFDKNFQNLNNSNISVDFSTTTAFNATSLFHNSKTAFSNIHVSGNIDLGSYFSCYGTLVGIATRPTTISNCKVNMTVAAVAPAGGFIYQATDVLNITGSSIYGQMTTNDTTGGVVAQFIYTHQRLFNNVTTDVQVHGGDNVGLTLGVGYMQAGGISLSSCSINGLVNGNNNVGIIGCAQEEFQTTVSNITAVVSGRADSNIGLIGSSQGPVVVQNSQLNMNLAGKNNVAGIVGSYWVNTLVVTGTNITGTILDQYGVGQCYYGQAIGTTVTVTSTQSSCNCGAGCA